MGQEQPRVFRIRVSEGSYFCSRDTVSGAIYQTQLCAASARADFDTAALIVARLIDQGFDFAAVTDISGRPIGPNNDRPANVPDEDVLELWGPNSLTAQE